MGETGEREKEVLLLPSLSGWLDKGDMSEEMFLTAFEKRRKALVWPNQEGKATCFFWQLKYFNLHLGTGLT